ncbi:MAG: T9SS type A sorting domain-containing protein [Calditrichaeota bacterium]|nr:T9SS type A sorting domain-containing protein [Calditrichota bacterium]MCB9369252.1 T9SS type A sorting domain-containing protein [Calditrichota bacterium]
MELRPAFFPRFLTLDDGYFLAVRDFTNGQIVFRLDSEGEIQGSDTLGLGDCLYSYQVNGAPRLVSHQTMFGESAWQMRTVLYEFDAQGFFADSVVLREAELFDGENPSGQAFHYDGSVLTCVAGSVTPSQTINDFRTWLTTYDGTTIMSTPPWDPGPLPLHSYITSWGVFRAQDHRFVLSLFIRGDDVMQFWFLGLEEDGTFLTSIRTQDVESNHLLNGLTMIEHEQSLIYAFTEVTTDGSFGGGARIAAFPISELLDVPRVSPQVSAEVSLSVYPNPFNSTSEIRFALPQFGRVRLSVFDVLGREVAVLADESLGAGGYVWHWQADGFASGKYFVRLDTGHESRTTPLILLK